MLQKSSVLGDLDKNFKIIEKSYKKCVSNKCDFFLTTELFLTGYPPQDLILRNDFLKKVQFYKKKIKALTRNKKSILLLNIPEKTNNKIFNTLFLFKNGSMIYKKISLYYQIMEFLMKRDILIWIKQMFLILLIKIKKLDF